MPFNDYPHQRLNSVGVNGIILSSSTNEAENFIEAETQIVSHESRFPEKRDNSIPKQRDSTPQNPGVVQGSNTSSYVPPNMTPAFNVSTPIQGFIFPRERPRTPTQLRVMRHGSKFIAALSLALLTIVYFLLGLQAGWDGIILFTLSLLPVLFILGIIRLFSLSQMPVALMVEMFWSGALLSILCASLLELVSENQTHKIWECQSTNPSVFCDLKFIIVVVVGVGFVEEFSKLLPLSRIKISESDMPIHHVWWWRLIESPHSLALAGLCSAAGFAGIENIKYVFSSGAAGGVGTSLWRALLAIPFHLACTTYASCQLAKLFFKKFPEDRLIISQQQQEPPELVSLTGTTSIVDRDQHSLSAEPYRQAFSNPSNQILWSHCLKCLITPSILHGFYDAGLFLAVQFLGLAERSSLNLRTNIISSVAEKFFGVLPFAQYYSSPALDGSESFSTIPVQKGNSDLYQTAAVFCLGLSLGSYVLIIVLSFFAWRDLKNLQPLQSPVRQENAYTVNYIEQEQLPQREIAKPSGAAISVGDVVSNQHMQQDFQRESIHGMELSHSRMLLGAVAMHQSNQTVGINQHHYCYRSSGSTSSTRRTPLSIDVEDDQREFFEK